MPRSFKWSHSIKLSIIQFNSLLPLLRFLNVLGWVVSRITTLYQLLLFQVKVFWVMTPCNVVAGYQRFGGTCYLHLQGEVSGAWIEIQVEVF
jgi:hypothetical protein